MSESQGASNMTVVTTAQTADHFPGPKFIGVMASLWAGFESRTTWLNISRNRGVLLAKALSAVHAFAQAAANGRFRTESAVAADGRSARAALLVMNCVFTFLTAVERTQEFRKNFAKKWQGACGNLRAVGHSGRHATKVRRKVSDCGGAVALTNASDHRVAAVPNLGPVAVRAVSTRT